MTKIQSNQIFITKINYHWQFGLVSLPSPTFTRDAALWRTEDSSETAEIFENNVITTELGPNEQYVNINNGRPHTSHC